jgi:hypothetical protein
MNVSDENYPLRRFIASNLGDNDIISTIVSLQEIIESLKMDKNHQSINSIQDFLRETSIKDKEVIQIAISETKNAMIPFFDEFESRHKN